MVRATTWSWTKMGAIGLLVLLLAVLGVVLGFRRYFADREAHSSPGRVPHLARKPLTITPGVHLLGGLSPSAAYVVETTAGLVLIDSGLDRDAGLLKAQMASLKLDWNDIRAILLTHAHGDHCGGAESLRMATNAKVYAGEGDVPVIRTGGPREAFFSTFHMPDYSPHPTTVDVVLRGDESFSLGDARVRAIGAPGHTPGSICYLIELKGLRMLFAGDVIMMLRGDAKPRTELGKPLGTYSAYLAPRYRGDARAFLASLQVLRSLPVPDLVFPGHPAADPTPQSPCISREQWDSLLENGVRDMQTLIAHYDLDGADFLDGTPKRLLPDLFYLGERRGSAVYSFVASSKFFLVDALGGPGLVDFLNERLRGLGVEPQPPTAVLLTSCGTSETAGLGELIEKCHVQVIAPPGAILSLRKSCPAGTVFLPADELSAKGWFPVSPIALEGRGLFPIAYQMELSGQRVLFSGIIPVKLNQEVGERLISDLTNPPGEPDRYHASLMQLDPAGPNLWLPAIPTDAQNANLYSGDWERILNENIDVIQFVEARSQRDK
jgi:glyoxylase-like metal-dependent hydrolase (beta-lactamase superfamily II)